MTTVCSHQRSIRNAQPSGPGCVECLQSDGWWMHLRRCMTCGHIGCCDSSPNKHASAHAHDTQHPIIQSYEPSEDWLWCYIDEIAFEIPTLQNSFSHPPGWSPGPPGKVPKDIL